MAYDEDQIEALPILLKFAAMQPNAPDELLLEAKAEIERLREGREKTTPEPEHKHWKEHHHKGLAEAIERLLHAAGCPTVDVDYHNSHGLCVTVNFDDAEDSVVDKAIFWALGAHEATEEG
jgi:hypothetical protein